LLDVIKETVANIATTKNGEIESIALYLEFVSELLPKNYIKKENSKPLGEILKEEGVVSEEDLKQALEEQRKPIGKILVEKGVVSEKQIEQALDKQKIIVKNSETKLTKKENETEKKSNLKHTKKQPENIRVDIRKLDTLINLIGELIISQNIIASSKEINLEEMSQIKKAVRNVFRV